MNGRALESLHRSRISELNELFTVELQYYRDAEIDPPIRPLVELLNNEWTLTTHCCGGHWDPPPRFQYPYVVFRRLDSGPAWPAIVRRTWRTLRDGIDSRVSINVTDIVRLPATAAHCSEWRFCAMPMRPGLSRLLFADGRDFRKTLDRWLEGTCEALEEAMRFHRRSPARCSR